MTEILLCYVNPQEMSVAVMSYIGKSCKSKSYLRCSCIDVVITILKDNYMYYTSIKCSSFVTQ